MADVQQINKSDLVNMVSVDLNMNQKSAKNAVNSLFLAIRKCLLAGHAVGVSDLGIFKLKHSGERNLRNPSTGEPLVVPPKTTVKFKPSVGLVAELNKSK